MQVRCNVVAQKREEAGNRKGFIAVTNHFEVYRMVVVKVGKEGDSRVDGDHENDPDDTRARLGVFFDEGSHRAHTVFVRRASDNAWHVGI
jgi:hypothetical protein